MASGNGYFDDLRSKPEVIDLPQNEDMMEVSEHVNDPAQTALKPNVTVSSSVRELLECPVCLNAMYPPIHQVWLYVILMDFYHEMTRLAFLLIIFCCLISSYMIFIWFTFLCLFLHFNGFLMGSNP